MISDLNLKWIILMIYFVFLSPLSRAKKGRAPCTWQPFTDASHALRSSSKTVSMTVLSHLSLTIWWCRIFSSRKGSLIHSLFFTFHQVGRLIVWISMAILLSTLLLSTAMNFWSALWWPTEQTQPGIEKAFKWFWFCSMLWDCRV